MSEILTHLFTPAVFIGILVSAVRIATPLLLAALGEMVSENSGILNLSIEGTMTLGAFAGFITMDWYSSYSNAGGGDVDQGLWFGLLAAVIIGVLFSLIMAFMAVTVKVNQIVAGLALNILGLGLAFFWFRIAFESGSSLNIPTVPTFDTAAIPGLSRIPVVGEALFDQHWLTYFAFLMVPVVWLVLTKTRYGLELRSIGHNPEACDMRGINIVPRQYAAVLFGGAMAALGGVFLSLASTGMFFPQIAASRGWIALAIVIFGNWRASWILWGSLFFGLIDALQLSLQATEGLSLPLIGDDYQVFLALPFVLTIVALVLNRSRSRSPLSLAIPYHRGER